MLGQTFYFSTTRKLVASFGTLFNNISIERVDSLGAVQRTIKVPLAYGPKKMWWAKLHQNFDADPKVKITAPRISFQIDSFTYDPSRQLNPIGARKYVDANDTNAKLHQFNGVPYNFNISLEVYAENMDDGLQIVEQILPYFRPDFNLTIIEIPEMDLRRDVPIILKDVAFEDNYDGAYDSNDRILTWSFAFEAKAYVYPPVSSVGVIKKTIVNTHSLDELKQYQEIIHAVNPPAAAEDDPHTVDKTVNEDL